VAYPIVSFVEVQTNGMVPPLSLGDRDVIVGAAIIVLLGFATGLWPAVQASRLRIVDALRKG